MKRTTFTSFRRLLAIALILSLSSLVVPQQASGAELNVNACKLSYPYGDMNSIGFPMTPNRLPSTGAHRQLIIAVDFPDAPFKGDTKAFLEKFTTPSLVSEFFDFNSYGKVKVDFDVYPEIVRLPEPSVNYGGDKSKTVLKNNTWSNDLIHRAALLILDQKIDLSKYSALATVVTGGETLSLAGGYASPVSPGFFRFKNGSFNHASLLGAGWMATATDPNAGALSWRVLAHEIGHLFGFIDLYMYNGEIYKQSTPGPFDLMAHATTWAPTLTAWNRWLMNWVTDSQVVCLDINSPNIEKEITALNTAGGLKAVVVRLSNSKVLVIESRKSDKFDSIDGNEGLLVYTVDLTVKSGEGAVRVIPELNEMNSIPEDRSINDILRFISATIKPGEFVSYQGLLIENLASSETADTLRISSGAEAIKNKTASEERAKKKAEQLLELQVAAKINRTIFTDNVCYPIGTLATFQILEGSTWKDVSVAQGWNKSSNCAQGVFYAPWIIKELPSFTKYRWRYDDFNRLYPRYSSTLTSPQTPADALAEAEAKAKAEAEAKAKLAAALKAKADEEARIRDEARISRTLYQDSSCHAYGTSAVLQAVIDGVWKEMKVANSWFESPECPSLTPRQPWVVIELPSNTQYRWKVSAPGWTSDWYSSIAISPVTAADQKAAYEAQLKAEQQRALEESNKKTITCVKGKKTKKVTALKPKCPVGYKKK